MLITILAFALCCAIYWMRQPIDGARDSRFATGAEDEYAQEDDQGKLPFQLEPVAQVAQVAQGGPPVKPTLAELIAKAKGNPIPQPEEKPYFPPKQILPPVPEWQINQAASRTAKYEVAQSEDDLEAAATLSESDIDLLKYLPPVFIVLDIETTGLDPCRDEIIEIAAMKFTIGKDQHAGMSTLVKIDGNVPTFITELTGITSVMLERDGVDLKIALESLTNLIGNFNIVAYNSKFDIGFLNEALQSVGMPKMKNTSSCALKMARRAWPDLKNYKLTNLARLMEEDSNGAHRALADTMLAFHVYIKAAFVLKKMR